MSRALLLTLLPFALLPFVACATGAGGGSADGFGDASSDAAEGDAAVEAAIGMEGGVVDSTTRPPADTGAPGTGEDATAADAGSTDASMFADVEANPCADGGILCNFTCVSPTDPDNCGACGNACTTGVCGTTLAADMATSPLNWEFNGSAFWDSTIPSARLTAADTNSVAGTVVYVDPIVTDEFTASFSFRIGAGGGGQFDGMGFMIQTTGPGAVGANGGGLGMAGLTGFGAELDIYDNGNCGDGNANHVGIDTLNSCGNSFPTSLFASNDLTGTVTLYDGMWHAAVVQLATGTMTVSVDGNPVAGIFLPGLTAGTPYYYGFAGAIGGGGSSNGMRTEVKDVSITFPTPRCL